MKIGCCSNMLYRESARTDDDNKTVSERLARTGFEYIKKIARAGFDYVELPLAQVTDLTEAEFELLQEQLKTSDITCPACNNFFPTDIRLTGPDVNDTQVDAYVAKALQRAAALGASRVVFGSGPAKNVPKGFPMAEGYRQVQRMLKRIAPVALANKITIAIEPLRKQECNLINTFAEGCQLARDVDDANVKVLVDYYHLGTEREPASHIVDNAELLCHVHTARLAERGFPTELDDELNLQFYQALKTVNYSGGISLEAFTSDFEREAPAALEFLRQQIR
ncbi:MAG: sugar phosphate isomerase/epimerase family protein [Saccharofermentanales bacterium]